MVADKIDKLGDEVFGRIDEAFNAFRQGRITQAELSAYLYRMAGVLEEAQWQNIEECRGRVPELAEFLEAILRKGSGNA